jgi:2-keto-4-pentenoate hydratase/2-oxohepta-3-ene-1,7-dioic acid hydratase in catechol pathway
MKFAPAVDCEVELTLLIGKRGRDIPKERLISQPSDLFATGTSAGVGLGFNPPKFLKAGDDVPMSITGSGTLTNRFA